VLRLADALAKRDTATDAAQFLVGVWLDAPPQQVLPCPKDSGSDPSAPDSWNTTGGCEVNYVSGEAGAGPIALSGVVTFRFLTGGWSDGAAILQAHVHDPRASQCGAAEPVCDDMIVVDSILWKGDATTAPGPYSVSDAVAAAAAMNPSTTLVPPSPSHDWAGGVALMDATHLTTDQIRNADMVILTAAVEPSEAALARALPSVQPGVAGALLPAAEFDTTSAALSYRWLVVGNVAFLVATQTGPTDADKTFLANLDATLKASRH
jgi:hypothetical protein